LSADGALFFSFAKGERSHFFFAKKKKREKKEVGNPAG
jgi:hypothetical protein